MEETLLVVHESQEALQCTEICWDKPILHSINFFRAMTDSTRREDYPRNSMEGWKNLHFASFACKMWLRRLDRNWRRRSEYSSASLEKSRMLSVKIDWDKWWVINKRIHQTPECSRGVGDYNDVFEVSEGIKKAVFGMSVLHRLIILKILEPPW